MASVQLLVAGANQSVKIGKFKLGWSICLLSSVLNRDASRGTVKALTETSSVGEKKAKGIRRKAAQTLASARFALGNSRRLI